MRDLVDQMGGGRGSMPLRDDDDAVESVHLVDLTLVLHYDTGKAIHVSETGDENLAEWFPHSLISFVKEGKKVQGVRKNGQHVALEVVTVTTPEWLAKEKWLI